MATNRVSTAAYENFTIERIILSKGEKGFDLSNAFIRMDIDESIENGFMKGSFDFIDTMNLTDALVMGGTEFVQLSFFSRDYKEVNGPEFEKLFRVSRYEDITDADTMKRKFTRVHFVSVGEIENDYHKVSKSYKQVGSHLIVGEMLEILGYPESYINLESTLNNKDIVIPNLSPLQVINHMTQTSQSGKANNKSDSNYYFYESRDKVNFVSGSTLTQADPVVDLIYGPTDEITMYGKIIKYERVRGFNLSDQLRNGGLGVTVNSHSLVNKLYKTEYVDFATAKKDYPMMNPVKWFDDIESNRNMSVKFRPEDQLYKFLNKGAHGNSAAIRHINRTSLQAKRAFAQVPGDTNITAGVTVNLAMHDQKGEINIKDSGKWLVNRVTHLITQENYFMNLELVSDSNIVRSV